MPTLAFEIDDTMNDDDMNDDDLYEGEDLDPELPELDADEDDVICPVCKEIIEDGVQCTFCGYLIGV